MKTSVRRHLRRTAFGKTDVRKHTRQLSSDQRGIDAAKHDIAKQSEHAHHSAIREKLEGIQNALKEHREKKEQERKQRAEKILAEERTKEEADKKIALERLEHEKKIADIRKIEDEAAALKKERFNRSFLGKTLNVAGKAAKFAGTNIVKGAAVAAEKAVEIAKNSK